MTLPDGARSVQRWDGMPASEVRHERASTTLLLERAGLRITAVAVVTHLRDVGHDAREPRYITTVRAPGYRLGL